MPLTLGKYDQVGAVARTVADLALFDTVVTGDTSPLPERALRGVRLGIPTVLMTNLDADVERVTLAGRSGVLLSSEAAPCT